MRPPRDHDRAGLAGLAVLIVALTVTPVVLAGGAARRPPAWSGTWAATGGGPVRPDAPVAVPSYVEEPAETPPTPEPTRSASPTAAATPPVASPSPSEVVRPEPKSVALLHRLESVKQNVVFITIDDGFKRDPRVLDLIRRTKLPVTLFLASGAAKSGTAYFRQMMEAGAAIENHTVRHRRLAGTSLKRQRDEICKVVPLYTELFGRAPTLLRAPYGATDRNTMRAAAACGQSAVVGWSAVMADGRLRTWLSGKLQPGDIILMHFNDQLFDDLTQLTHIIKRQGLRVGLLEDFITR